jgi:aspartate 1-decarboxylase
VDNEEAQNWTPHLVFVDERNRLKANPHTVRMSA